MFHATLQVVVCIACVQQLQRMHLVERHHVYMAWCDTSIGGKADCCRSVLVLSSNNSDTAFLSSIAGSSTARCLSSESSELKLRELRVLEHQHSEHHPGPLAIGSAVQLCSDQTMEST